MTCILQKSLGRRSGDYVVHEWQPTMIYFVILILPRPETAIGYSVSWVPLQLYSGFPVSFRGGEVLHPQDMIKLHRHHDRNRTQAEKQQLP